MRKHLWIDWLVCASVAMPLIAGGCARGKGDDRPKPYKLCLEASPRLNWYEGREHALYLRVFHLSSRDAFERADLAALRSHDAELPGQVAPTTDRNVYPGATTEMEVLVDSRTIFLGVVGHYFDPQGESKRLLSVENLEDEEACKDVDADQINWVRLGANAFAGARSPE